VPANTGLLSIKTMKTITKISCILLLFTFGIAVQRASSQQPVAKKVQDLNATGKPVYYNLEKGTAVDEADTAKTSWDLSFQRTAITLQATASGQLLENSDFEKIEHAPSAGYTFGKGAIPMGSGKSWYLYNMDNHTVSPIPGKVILIRTASGKYYKLIIDSYYKAGQDGPSGYYTFRYKEIVPGN
jgi:hypothetical protein